MTKEKKGRNGKALISKRFKEKVSVQSKELYLYDNVHSFTIAQGLDGVWQGATFHGTHYAVKCVQAFIAGWKAYIETFGHKQIENKDDDEYEDQQELDDETSRYRGE